MKPHSHISRSWLLSSWNSNGGDVLEVSASLGNSSMVSSVCLVVGNSAASIGIISSPPNNTFDVIGTDCSLVATMRERKALHSLSLSTSGFSKGWWSYLHYLYLYLETSASHGLRDEAELSSSSSWSALCASSSNSWQRWRHTLSSTKLQSPTTTCSAEWK